MTIPVRTLVHTSTRSLLSLALLTTLVMVEPTFADDAMHENHAVPAKLVRIVREATRQFLNVSNAGPDYAPAFGCVSGPDHGAMGIHYLNGTLVGDGEIDEKRPEALIYEPIGNRRRLLGVEYIVDAATWLSAHDNTPPQLEGQAFQFVDSPNRFGIPAFFELHVWAWRDNPNGAFVDWNNNVSCEGH
jgi:hypothetical protein